jgi:uncharacterized cupredoxin-like copper-binding protein
VHTRSTVSADTRDVDEEGTPWMTALLRHLRSNAVAYLALFVALSAGTALAASKVRTNDIANDAVTSKKIKNGQIKAADLGKGIPYYGDPPVVGETASNSEDKTLFVQCEKGKVPVTGSAWIEGAPGYVALSESRQASPPADPKIGWVASAIEVNGGTAEDWTLKVGLACAKVKGPASRKILVKLDEYKLKPDVASVRAGAVRIKAKNVGDGEHELVVASSDLKPGRLPTAGGDVDEDAIDVIGEVPEMPPGKTGATTLDLAPGKYVMFCNVPGHYAAGMYGRLNVK